MNAKCVKELMIPLDAYAVVPRDATLVETVRAVRQAEHKLRPARQPARAVLVSDPDGTIVGQLGHLEILQALEARYCLLADMGRLSRSGVSEELFASLVDNLNFWRREVRSVSKRARHIKVSDLMRPIAESISEDASLSEATHQMVNWQSTRALVTRSGRVVGVLRVADLFAEVTDCIDRDNDRDESAGATRGSEKSGSNQTAREGR